MITIRSLEELQALLAVYPKVAAVLPKAGKLAEGSTRKYMGAICSLPTQAELDEEQNKVTTDKRNQEFFGTLVKTSGNMTNAVREWLSKHPEYVRAERAPSGGSASFLEEHPEYKARAKTLQTTLSAERKKMRAAM